MNSRRSHSNRLSLLLGAPVALLACLALAGTAQAYHPEVSQMRVVQSVAHELEDAARQVHRIAERNEHHYDYREERALRALHELEEAADDFHRQVERHRQNPYRTERYYQTLERCYADAYRAFFGLHAFRHVERAFYRVDELMKDLRYYYTAPDRGHYGDDHHYDRNRGYRGDGEYRGYGRYRRHGEYRRHGRYRGSNSGHRHYEGCGHDGH